MLETFFTSDYLSRMPLIILASIILLFLTIILTTIIYTKTHKKYFITIGTIFVFIFSFISYFAVPYYYTYKAITTDKISNYEQAIKAEIIPYHKGILYCDLSGAYQRLNKGQEAIKNYEIGYSYTKNHNNLESGVANILYLSQGDYEKAIEISKAQGYYELLAIAYILQNKYNMALNAINKAINKSQYPLNAYEIRAIIYKNLNKDELANKDLKKALDICKKNHFTNRTIEIKNDFKNYKTCFSDKYKKSKEQYGF